MKQGNYFNLQLAKLEVNARNGIFAIMKRCNLTEITIPTEVDNVFAYLDGDYEKVETERISDVKIFKNEAGKFSDIGFRTIEQKENKNFTQEEKEIYFDVYDTHNPTDLLCNLYKAIYETLEHYEHTNKFCPHCGKELNFELNKTMDNYPYVCYDCDENFFNIEDVEK